MTSVALRRVASYSETTATTTTPTPTKTKRYTILRRRKRADEGERAPWESPVISHPISSTSSTPTVSTPNRSFLNPNPDPVARGIGWRSCWTGSMAPSRPSSPRRTRSPSSLRVCARRTMRFLAVCVPVNHRTGTYHPYRAVQGGTENLASRSVCQSV
ncbi:hypothetical protein GW17_00014540 [Ensete ventricosum]|nr:hypothetical protein GW17_00014540 [Ensete ventricosum]